MVVSQCPAHPAWVTWCPPCRTWCSWRAAFGQWRESCRSWPAEWCPLYRSASASAEPVNRFVHPSGSVRLTLFLCVFLQDRYGTWASLEPPRTLRSLSEGASYQSSALVYFLLYILFSWAAFGVFDGDSVCHLGNVRFGNHLNLQWNICTCLLLHYSETQTLSSQTALLQLCFLQ